MPDREPAPDERREARTERRERTGHRREYDASPTAPDVRRAARTRWLRRPNAWRCRSASATAASGPRKLVAGRRFRSGTPDPAMTDGRGAVAAPTSGRRSRAPSPAGENQPGATRPNGCDGGTPIGPENRRISWGRSGHYTRRILWGGSGSGAASVQVGRGSDVIGVAGYGMAGAVIRVGGSNHGPLRHNGRATLKHCWAETVFAAGKWSAASMGSCPLWSARGAGVKAGAPRQRGRSAASALTVVSTCGTMNCPTRPSAAASVVLESRRRREPPRRPLHAGLLLRLAGPVDAARGAPARDTHMAQPEPPPGTDCSVGWGAVANGSETTPAR